MVKKKKKKDGVKLVVIPFKEYGLFFLSKIYRGWDKKEKRKKEKHGEEK